MGMCLPCLGGTADDYDDDTPDPEVRRVQMARAAERRKQEQESKGIKDPERLKQKQRQKEDIEKKAAINNTAGDRGGLKWQVG